MDDRMMNKDGEGEKGFPENCKIELIYSRNALLFSAVPSPTDQLLRRKSGASVVVEWVV